MNKWRALNYFQLVLAATNVPFFPSWGNVASFVFCLGMFYLTRKYRKQVE